MVIFVFIIAFFCDSLVVILAGFSFNRAIILNYYFTSLIHKPCWLSKLIQLIVVIFIRSYGCFNTLKHFLRLLQNNCLVLAASIWDYVTYSWYDCVSIDSLELISVFLLILFWDTYFNSTALARNWLLFIIHIWRGISILILFEFYLFDGRRRNTICQILFLALGAAKIVLKVHGGITLHSSSACFAYIVLDSNCTLCPFLLQQFLVLKENRNYCRSCIFTLGINFNMARNIIDKIDSLTILKVMLKILSI